ncbi:MAG: Spx/MgsR family RNA polymerase-binding regulatory protein [Deltaproteobacteria bacterium]|nr:Spx/MgsR family RNA polymerase-binding regulatory protein [Deltaproteobacteria bacterium]
MGIKVYCYSGCGTCKKALKYLDSKGVAYQLIPIRETPPSKSELRQMLKYLDGDLKKLFNTSSKDYREGGFKETITKISEKDAFEALSSNGNLIKRPFILNDTFGIVGFKEDLWDAIFQRFNS